MDPPAPGLEALRRLLVAKREVLTAILVNPSVIEHDGFTDLLWATFHLAEELTVRAEALTLSQDDSAHLALDVERVFPLLVSQWLNYLSHSGDQFM